jgi:hypothetical protein
MIVRADGRAKMPFASDLANHLANRANSSRFRLGEWIASLEGAELASLIALADRTLKGDNSGAAELLAIYLLGVAAERGNASSQYLIKLEDACDFSERIGILAVMEDFHRQGMLALQETTSLDAFEQNRVAITDQGRHEAEILDCLYPRADFKAS